MQSTVISTLPIILDNCQNEASTDLHHKSDMTLSQLQVLDEHAMKAKLLIVLMSAASLLAFTSAVVEKVKN